MRELAIWASIGRASKAQTCPTLWHSVDCTLPGSLICGIFHWSGLPFCLPGNLSDPGINLHLPPFLHWQVDSLPLSHLGISKTEGTAIEKAVWKKRACLVGSRNSEGSWNAAALKEMRCVCVRARALRWGWPVKTVHHDENFSLAFTLRERSPWRGLGIGERQWDSHNEIPGIAYLHLPSWKLTGRGVVQKAAEAGGPVRRPLP